MAKEIVIKNEAEMAERLQEFMTLHAAITADAPKVLAEEKDPKVMHASLIARSEHLYKLSVGLRAYFGDLAKQCIGPDESVAGRAVVRRKELIGEKPEKPAPVATAKTPSAKNKETTKAPEASDKVTGIDVAQMIKEEMASK